MNNPLSRPLSWLSQCSGKRRYIVAFLLGVGATLAFSPLYLLPLLFIGFSGLLLQIISCTGKKQAFLTGWWFGFGHFTTGIYWITYALLTDAAQFGWLVPFAVFGIAGVLALYCAVVAWVTYIAPVKSIISKALILSLAWVVCEFARNYLLSGFPWNLVGYVWAISDATMQIASVTGIYGLGLLTVLVASSLAVFISSKPGRNIAFPVVMFGVFVLAGGWGYLRIDHAQDNYVDAVKLRIVQGNIEQKLKWLPGQREINLQKYINLTRREGFDTITHVIWPETAIPYALRQKNPELEELFRYVAPPHGVLLTGAMRLEEVEDDYNVWNSLFAITQKGIYSHYDKFHLVPFGEYIPLRAWLPDAISKITQGPKDFSTGSGPKPLALPDGTTVLPLICYEGIFPQYVNGEVKEPYSWILNITNDAWFGVSSGPYQHFNMVRMRAVEQGTPLVRAANTGISAVIDPYGRVVSSLALNRTGILDSPLPQKIGGGTIYSNYGKFITLLLIVICAVFAYLLRNISNNSTLSS